MDLNAEQATNPAIVCLIKDKTITSDNDYQDALPCIKTTKATSICQDQQTSQLSMSSSDIHFSSVSQVNMSIQVSI